MNSEEQESRERGDSDDEIAELRFQALLTKKENEAEVSPSHKSLPHDDTLLQMAMNQPLSNFRGQQFNYRGRGSNYYKPYLHTFSQQIASKSVNSNNIVVLTSSEPEDVKPSFAPDWSSGRGRYMDRGGRWPRGMGRGQLHMGNIPPTGGHQAPPLVLPQDKYAMQTDNTQPPGEHNKTKLSARMRRLQGSDSDSEESDTDSSDDSSSNSSSSDSNSSSSDSSSSDSDSESENSQAPVKKVDKSSKKDKGDSIKHAPQASAEHLENNHNSSNYHPHSNSSKKVKSPVKMPSTKQSLPLNSNMPKGYHSPSFRKDSLRSPVSNRRSRSPSPASYPLKAKSPLRPRRSTSFSPRGRRFSRTPPRRSRTPTRRYGSRTPPRFRGSHSPVRGLRSSKSPLPILKKMSSKSPTGRFRSRSRSPYFGGKRYKSRSPYLQKRRGSRSPLPPRRISRSPVGARFRSRSPLLTKRYGSRSPRPIKRYGSISPPPGRSYNARSPYSIRRYGSRSPRPYPKKLSPGSPKRYRSISPRNARSPPPYKDYLPKPSGMMGKSPPRRRKNSFSPNVKRYGSRSPLPRGRDSPKGKRTPEFHGRDRTPLAGHASPQRIKRIGSLSPKPLGGQSPFRKFKIRSPVTKRYGTPPPRRISPSLNIQHMEPMPEAGLLRSPPFGRVSPRGHNYAIRSPSPMYRGRFTPPPPLGVPISGRNFPGSPNSVFYGSRPEHMHGKVNRNIAFEKDVGPFQKRFPVDQHPPPWLPHKSELMPPQKQPPAHHYPPKFSEVEYGARPGYSNPHHQSLPEKVWQPSGPPGRGFNHFGNGRGGHVRIERLNDIVVHQPLLGERGRGGRGMRGARGQRGNPRGGVHARLGRGTWSGQQGGFEHPPQFDEPYLREKPIRAGIPLSPEADIGYMGRKPQPFDNLKPIPPNHPQRPHSPGVHRIPRGPKTPPYSPPNREPSPIEWEKRGRGNLKQRTPSLSPSPRRYGNENSQGLNKPPRDRRGDSLNPRSNSETAAVGHRQVHYPARSRSPLAKHIQLFTDPHRLDPRRDNSREVDDRRRPIRGEDNYNKHKDYKKGPIGENKTSIADEKSIRDRREDDQPRSPYQARPKGSGFYNNNLVKKDFEGDPKLKREKDSRGRRDNDESRERRDHDDLRGRKDTEELRGRKEPEEPRGRREPEEPRGRREPDEHRGRKENEEPRGRREPEESRGRREPEEPRGRRDNEDRGRRDNEESRGKREPEEPRGRRENEEHKRRHDNEEHKGRKENDEQKGRRNEEDRKTRRDNDDHRGGGRRENFDDRSIKRDNDDHFGRKGEREAIDDRSKGRKKIESERDIKSKRDKKENIDREKNIKRQEKKSDKLNDITSKPKETKLVDEKRENIKDASEHIRNKETKQKVDTHEEKKKKRKKHREEDRSKSNKKKKKEKKKKKDSKKQKKKLKDSDNEQPLAKKKKSTEGDPSSLSTKEDDLRHLLGKREDGPPRDKGIKRKEIPLEEDRESRKRRKDEVPSGKEDWKYRSRGKDERPIPSPKDKDRRFPSEKRGNASGRGGKGLFVTVSSGIDRQVSNSNAGKDATKKEGPRLPVHMRLGGKQTADNSEGAIKVAKKGGGQRMGDNISGPRRKGGPAGGGGGPQQASLRRQGMKGPKLSNR